MRDHYSVQELKEIVSKIPLDDILNKKGVVYKERKEELVGLSDEQLIEEMAKEPKLIRRPIIISGNEVIVGYDPAKFEASLK